MKTIRGRKAMVTGASAGIGRAIAIALADRGADLYLVDIDAANLKITEQFVKDRGVVTATAVCDLSDPTQVSALVKSLLSSWGYLNILVNNAGIAYYGPTHDMTGEQWNAIMSINLMAPIQLVRELLPTLLAQDEAHVLNMCSIFGLVTMRRIAAYETSKFGLVGFTSALRAEYGHPCFGVTALCPGFVNTSMTRTFMVNRPDGSGRTLPPWLCTTPEKVAAAAITAIERNKGMVTITAMAHLFWWLARLSPSLVDWLNRQGWRRRPKVELPRI